MELGWYLHPGTCMDEAGVVLISWFVLDGAGVVLTSWYVLDGVGAVLTSWYVLDGVGWYLHLGMCWMEWSGTYILVHVR